MKKLIVLLTAAATIFAACDKTESEIKVTDISLDRETLTLDVGQTWQLTATLTPANATNKRVAWRSSNAAVATVADGLVTAVSEGSANIYAVSIDGNKSAVCQVTVQKASVPVTGIDISLSSKEAYVGDVFRLTATVLPENADEKGVTWSSSNTSVATVTSAGEVTAVAAGSATITVASVYDSNIKATCALTVVTRTVPPTGVSLDVKSKDLVEGESFVLTATISPADATETGLKWSSSNEAVATVVNGRVTAVASGTAVITVALTYNESFKDECTVTVSATTVPATGISISDASKAMKKGETYKLTATVEPANASNKGVDWSSDNTAVATVAADGTVTAVASGTAVITATSQDGGFTKTCTVTVTTPVTSVTLDTNAITLLVGGEGQTLVATVNPSDADNKAVTWSTSNAGVATVENGAVTPVAEGTATITVTTVDGGLTATCKVTVQGKQTGGTFSSEGFNKGGTFNW